MDSNTVGFAILYALLGAGVVLILYLVVRMALVDDRAEQERKRRGT